MYFTKKLVPFCERGRSLPTPFAVCRLQFALCHWFPSLFSCVFFHCSPEIFSFSCRPSLNSLYLGSAVFAQSKKSQMMSKPPPNMGSDSNYNDDIQCGPSHFV